MLVLSRREKQRIRFPGLGIAVEILDIKNAKVRIGVDAPMEVRVLRDELEEFDRASQSKGTPANAAHDGQPPAPDEPHVIRLPQTMRHELRNALNELSLMLHVYRKRVEQTGEAEQDADEFSPASMFEAIVNRIEDLGQHGAISKQGVPAANIAADRPTLGRALVVDDDDNERELLAGFLRMCGYEVDVARDGLHAIEHVQLNPTPQFILLDMNMPNCDGKSFLKQFRAIDACDPIDVFVVSGKTPAELELDPTDGYTHWFNKPLDPRLVVEQLASIEQKN